MSHPLWPPSWRLVERKPQNQWSMCVSVCVLCTSGSIGPYYSVLLPTVTLLASFSWDLQVTRRSFLVSSSAHDSTLPPRPLVYCSSSSQPQRPPPSPLRMSHNGFTLIKWDSMSVPSQATGNSRNKRNYLWGCVLQRACMCVCVTWNCKGPHVYLSVLWWRQHVALKITQGRECVCMCVLLYFWHFEGQDVWLLLVWLSANDPPKSRELILMSFSQI